MTYLVNEKCIKCKLIDCIEVCPVDCFYEGKNMLVIKPDECIDCGVCEPECPVNAIKPDTEEGRNAMRMLDDHQPATGKKPKFNPDKPSNELGDPTKIKSLAELKKIKRNPTAPKSTQNSMANDVNNYNNWSRLQAGVQGHRDIDSQEYARRLQINAVRSGRGMTDKYPMPPRTGLK